MKKLIIILFLVLLFGCKKNDTNNTNNPIQNTITDIDGNIYHTVVIGTQTWMVENLKCIHYRNGDSIPIINNPNLWGNLSTGACCEYNNLIINCLKYGKLYNWFSVHDSRNIAPYGWHVPSDYEWTLLVNYLRGSFPAGSKLIPSGSSGFNALAGGLCSFNSGEFAKLDSLGYWWCNNEDGVGSEGAFVRVINYFGDYIFGEGLNKHYGLSVRCVKDIN